MRHEQCSRILHPQIQRRMRQSLRSPLAWDAPSRPRSRPCLLTVVRGNLRLLPDPPLMEELPLGNHRRSLTREKKASEPRKDEAVRSPRMSSTCSAGTRKSSYLPRVWGSGPAENLPGRSQAPLP